MTLRRLVLCAALLPGPSLAFDDDVLERASALSRGGAPRLALKVLENNQPPFTDIPRWSAWERRRGETLRALKDWEGIARRAEELPPVAPAPLRRTVLFEAAEAKLAQRDTPGALAVLRQLIWREGLSVVELARAQRLVIRAYLTDDNLVDAKSALARYRAQHGRGEAWQVLHAEVLLRSGDPKAAFEVLAGAQSHEARLLRLAAALRGKLYAPGDVFTTAGKLAHELRAQPEPRRQAYAVAAEAAARTGDREARVRLLEAALAAEAAAYEAGVTPDHRVFAASADDLWSAYEELGEESGNAARLVIGNDKDWFAHAKGKMAKAAPVARALYAFLARVGTESTQETAHARLAESLFVEGSGAVAQLLYTLSDRYREPGAVPAAVRYRLADKALADRNIRLAAALVRDLKQPRTDDEDPDGWILRRARILIYADDDHEATALLSNLLESKRKPDENFSERYVQVLFDLQAVRRHREALTLLEGLYARVDSDRLRRELLFWRADSQAALGKHREAAELYLRSATHGGVNGEDPWGHTARFHAAGELARAGLVDDARDVYARLLESTPDPKRRLILERQVQQLWIAERQQEKAQTAP